MATPSPLSPTPAPTFAPSPTSSSSKIGQVMLCPSSPLTHTPHPSRTLLTPHTHSSPSHTLLPHPCILSPFHPTSIQLSSSCPCRSLLLTASEDKTVRLWGSPTRQRRDGAGVCVCVCVCMMYICAIPARVQWPTAPGKSGH